MSELNRNRKILIASAEKETAYADGVPAVDSMIKADQDSIGAPEPTIINDQDLLGASREPASQEILALHNTLALNQSRCKYHTLATVAAFGLGSISSALADTASSTYKHVFGVLDADALPTTVIEELYKSGVQKLYPGAGCQSFTLRVNRGTNRRVGLSSNWFMSGDSSAGTGDVTEKSEAAINGGASAVYLGAVAYSGTTDDDVDMATTDLAATPTTITSSVRSFEWSFDNNVSIEDLFRLGSGLYPGAFERGDINQTVTLNFDYASEAEVDRLINQTQVAFQFKHRGAEIETGFYYGLNLIFPALQYESARRAIDNGKLVNQITMRVLQEPTYGSVVMNLFNEIAAYAAAAA